MQPTAKYTLTGYIALIATMCVVSIVSVCIVIIVTMGITSIGVYGCS